MLLATAACMATTRPAQPPRHRQAALRKLDSSCSTRWRSSASVCEGCQRQARLARIYISNSRNRRVAPQWDHHPFGAQRAIELAPYPFEARKRCQRRGHRVSRAQDTRASTVNNGRRPCGLQRGHVLGRKINSCVNRGAIAGLPDDRAVTTALALTHPTERDNSLARRHSRLCSQSVKRAGSKIGWGASQPILQPPSWA